MATNSTFASARQYKEDVSDVIREKISLFRSQEHRILALEFELNDLREQHNRLEQELEPYRLQYRTMRQISAFSDPLNDPCLIHRLPDELLYSIFKLCIRGLYKTHRRTIGMLLFVCKRWYTLTMGGPTLWSNIQIDDSFKFFDFVNRRSRISYVDSCLSRSQGLPLDIEVNFEEVDEMGYIKAELIQHAEIILNENEHAEVSDQIHNQDWPLGASRFYEELHPFLDHLFGDNGQHLKRCHTLSIDLPDDFTIMDIIFSRMAQNVPNLTSLKIDNPLHWSVEDAFPRVLDLPRVEDLTIRSRHGQPISLSHLGLSRTVLKQINMDVGESILHLEELSSFKYLRSLELSCPGFSRQADEAVAAPLFSVQLAYLDSFGLVDWYMEIRKIRFEFPSLQVLSLAPCDESQRLPALSSSPRTVAWRLNERFTKRIQHHPRMLLMPLLEDVFLHSKTIQRMTFPWLIKDAVLELVGQYQKRGDLPSLSHIMLERTGCASQVVEVVPSS
jgi:hypothetical protein